MPFDSEGNFTRVHKWEEDRQNDIDIVSDRHDEEDDNFASGFNNCLLRDGRATMTGDLDAGNFKVKRIADGTVSTDAVNKGQLDKATSGTTTALKTLLNKLCKIGDIKQSVRDANHDSWFLCNGQAINRVTYSELFSLIGTRFGGGDGTMTFNLPDYRGKFIRGLGGDSAADIYTTQNESLPNHTHNVTTQQGMGNLGGGGYYEVVIRSNTTSTTSGASSPVYVDGGHVTPINQALNFFIKVKEEA